MNRSGNTTLYSILRTKWLNHIIKWNILLDLFAPMKGRAGKELIWVIIGQVVALSGGIVGIRLLTGHLGPEAYGELALGTTIAGFLGQILFGPLGQSLGHPLFRPKAKENNAEIE
jgi:hypothetical protein